MIRCAGADKRMHSLRQVKKDESMAALCCRRFFRRSGRRPSESELFEFHVNIPHRHLVVSLVLRQLKDRVPL